MRQLHPDVAEADDGNLFLTRGRHDVFAHATGRAPIRDEVLENFRLNIGESPTIVWNGWALNIVM